MTQDVQAVFFIWPDLCNNFIFLRIIILINGRVDAIGPGPCLRYLLFQDIICSASQKLKCWSRIAWYHTDGYNSSIAAYENDLLYYFAIPSFFGAGIRTYLNLKWQPLQFLSIYLKAGYTLRAGVTLMSSGNDATQGDHRFDVRGQICLRF